MKTNKYMSIAAGIMLLFGAMGCEKQLDIPQHGSIGVEEFYKTDADAESAVANLYCVWRGAFADRMYLFTLLSDEVHRGGNHATKFAPFPQLLSWTFNSGNSYVASYYKSCYNIIYAANLIIDNMGEESPVKKQVVAEAKFFRAYAHFHLAALWGETAPTVDHLLKPDEYHVGNSEPGKIWELVEKDLKDAIQVLPSKSGVNDQSLLRVSKEAAEVYLGNAYLWQKKYADAAKEYEKVIDSGKYKLWDGAFENLTHVPANGCCEKVLEAQVPNDLDNYRTNGINSGNGFWGNAGLYLNFFSQTKEAKNTFASGNGYFPPREGLYNAFVAEEGVDGYRLKSSIRTMEQMPEAGLTCDVNGTILFFSDKYFNWKTRILKSDLMGNPGRNVDNQYINYCYVRYAEVLLLAAEAEFRAGDKGKAEGYLNQVRQRAKLADKTGITLDDIKTEKRLELAFEGVRYMDLTRWQRIEGEDDAYNAMKDQDKVVYNIKVSKDKSGNVSYEKVVAVEYPNAGYQKGKHELLPFPLEEMEVNGEGHGGTLKQNPGW